VCRRGCAPAALPYVPLAVGSKKSRTPRFRPTFWARIIRRAPPAERSMSRGRPTACFHGLAFPPRGRRARSTASDRGGPNGQLDWKIRLRRAPVPYRSRVNVRNNRAWRSSAELRVDLNLSKSTFLPFISACRPPSVPCRPAFRPSRSWPWGRAVPRRALVQAAVSPRVRRAAPRRQGRASCLHDEANSAGGALVRRAAAVPVGGPLV